MDNTRTIKQETDKLYSTLEKIDLTKDIANESLDRTKKFKENFLIALSKQHFNDELLDIGDEEFEDLSAVFFNIRESMSFSSGKSSQDYVETLPDGFLKDLTDIGINMIKTSIRRNSEKDSKSYPQDFRGFSDSQFYL